MLVKNIDMLCTKLEVKKSKEGNQYLMISLLDMLSGDLFDIVERDNLELLSKLAIMNKYNVNLKISSGKYGLNIKLDGVNDNLGSV